MENRNIKDIPELANCSVILNSKEEYQYIKDLGIPTGEYSTSYKYYRIGFNPVEKIDSTSRNSDSYLNISYNHFKIKNEYTFEELKQIINETEYSLW